MKNSVKWIIFYTLFLGFVYPLIIWVAGQVFWAEKTGGSLVMKDGRIIGSIMLAQDFSSDKYFSSRPSVIAYNPMPSGASNLSVTSRLLSQQVKERAAAFRIRNGLDSLQNIPADMLFASASGADPHISKESAYLQAGRIVRARNFDKFQQDNLFRSIDDLIEYPQFGVFGDPVVNVLKLNIRTDEIGDENGSARK